MPDITKIKRSQFVTFLDTTPSSTATWKLLGTGITDYAIAYNPQINTEKWIINDNATSDLDSNQKQGDVSQKMYKGDPCFEYANSLRDKVGAEVQTHVLDVDTYDTTATSTYKAKKSDAILAVTNYGGDSATIEYTIYYNGDPVEGTVTISDGVPTFVPSVSA